jgi:hypothetical protein
MEPWVATSCDRAWMVREGVSGSSPEEGSAKSAARRRFSVQPNLHFVARAVGVEPFMEISR